jgi:hypothetical protein
MIYPHSTRSDQKVLSDFKAIGYMNESNLSHETLVAIEKIIHKI